MAYQIDRFNRTLLTVVEDGTIDETTDLRFIGKNFAGYGEIHNENFLYLLENFSSANPPPKPLSGQVWFDSAQSKLKFYDGSIWRTTGGSEVTSSEPAGLTEGDFWWDNFNDQLYVFNGNSFVLIGPQAAGGSGVTQLVSQTILDDSNNNRSIVVAFVDDNPVYVISPTQFNILNQPGNTLAGFELIRQGITLKDTDSTGVTTSAFRFWGTAGDADKLGGTPASDYVRFSNPTFSNQIVANDGVNVSNTVVLGTAGSGTDGTIRNSVNGGALQFRITDSGGTSVQVASVSSTGIVPATDNTFDLGTSTLRFKNIYAESFSGGASEQSDQLKIQDTGDFTTASIDSAPSTVVVRDSDENIFANEFRGTATSAQYADLAEKYTTDKNYPPGTIMCVGGSEETTAASSADIVIGVISTAPAYLMNSEIDGQAIALKGRVPVRVKGPISKGQAVFAAEDGVGSTLRSAAFVGIALEDNTTQDESLVECVLKV